MTIGLHFPFEGDSFVLNPYFPELLEGLSAEAAESGSRVKIREEPADRKTVWRGKRRHDCGRMVFSRSGAGLYGRSPTTPCCPVSRAGIDLRAAA